MKSRPLIIGVDQSRLAGYLKFYSRKKKYGFVRATDGREYFCHLDDLEISGISAQAIKHLNENRTPLTFQCLDYYGKHSLSKKAVNFRVEG